ncbi:MAG: sugar-binding protein [Kiritimatiellia bacterium]|nr:sugar-binding protein [Kiritimatiellia bacterium]
MMARYLSVILLSAAVAGAVQAEMVDDFERGDLEGWNYHSLYWADNKGNTSEEPLGQIALNKDPRYVHGGKQSLKLEAWPGKRVGGAGYAWLAKRIPKLTEENDTFSFWHYCVSGAGKIFSVRLFGKGDNTAFESGEIPIAAGDGWKRITIQRDEFKRYPGMEWTQLGLIGIFVDGNFTAYLDDFEFVPHEQLAKEDRPSTNSPLLLPTGDDFVWIDFTNGREKGLKLSGASGKAAAAIKGGRKCMRITAGEKVKTKDIYLDAQEGFIPEKGTSVAVIMEYFDIGGGSANQNYYIEYKEGAGKLEAGRDKYDVRRINVFNHQDWKTDLFYLSSAAFTNSIQGADLRIWRPAGAMAEDSYLAKIIIKKLSGKEEEFLGAQMTDASGMYAGCVVKEAYLRDEVRQLQRGREILGVEEDIRPLERKTAEINRGIQDLYELYKELYCDVRVKYLLGERELKDKKADAYLKQAKIIEEDIGKLKEEIAAGLGRLDQAARAREPWFSDFKFEYGTTEPLPTDKVVPKELFGKRFFVGFSWELSYGMAVTKCLRVLGQEFNRSCSYGFHLCYTSIAEGEYDFSKAGEKLDNYGNIYGQRMTLYPVYAWWVSKALPAWYKKKHGDEIYPQTWNGTIGRGGGNIYHPAMKALWAESAYELGKYVKDSPYVFYAMFLGEAYNNVAAEPGAISATLYDGYDPIAKGKFREYLKEKYRNIEKLNQQWRAPYKDFNEIKPPEGIENTTWTSPLIYEFQKFRDDAWMDLVKTLVESYKKGDPHHLVANLADYYGPYSPFDIDSIGCKGGGFGRQHNEQYHYRQYYCANRLSGKPFCNREFNIVGDEGRYEGVIDPFILRNISEMGFWQQTAWGVSAVLVYCVGEGADNVLANEMNMSTIRWFSGNIPWMQDKWNRLSKAYAGTRVCNPKIGTIDSHSARENIVVDKWLFKEHFAPFIIDDRWIADGLEKLSDYKTLILNMPRLEDGVVEKLIPWVKKGGTLILSGPGGAYDKFGFYDGRMNREFFGIEGLEKKKGIKSIKGTGLEIDLKEKEFYCVNQWKENPKVEILARFNDNSPAIFAARYGKGKAYMSLAPFRENEEFKEMLFGWIREVQPVQDVMCDEELVEPVLREDGQGNRYLCLVNLVSDKECKPLIALNGEYAQVVDLGLGNGVPVKTRTEEGLTFFERRLGGGEGTVLWLGKRKGTAEKDEKDKGAKVRFRFLAREVEKMKEKTSLSKEINETLARIKDDIANKRYDRMDADMKTVRSVRLSMLKSEQKLGEQNLVKLAEEIKTEIERSDLDAVTKARLEVLRRAGLYAGAHMDVEDGLAYVQLSRAYLRARDSKLRPEEVELVCPKVKATEMVKIDGDLPEWDFSKAQAIPHSNITYGANKGEKDISGLFEVKWDEKYLYIAVKVTDDKVMNDKPEGSVWAGDSVEIALNMLDDVGMAKRGGEGDGLPVPYYGPDDLKLMIGADERHLVDIYSPVSGMKKIEGLKIATRKTSSGYEMEVGIPWEGLFLNPVEGYTIGLNVILNDNDMPGEKSSCQIAYRMCNATQTTGWVRMELGNKSERGKL